MCLALIKGLLKRITFANRTQNVASESIWVSSNICYKYKYYLFTIKLISPFSYLVNNKLFKSISFRMRRRSITNRLLQCVVVLSVSSLFICLLLYAVNFPGDKRGPDFSWLKTRNMTAFIRPGDFSTTLIEPRQPFCR